MPATRPKLTDTEHRCLALLDFRARVLTGIALELGLTTADARRLVDRLVDRGLIKEDGGFYSRVEA
jgi:DNA-binding MarR family transcriptional regulator